MKKVRKWELSIAEKLLGIRRINKDSIDFVWGYFAPRFGFELLFHRGGYFDSHMAISFCLIWGMVHITLPFKTKLREGCELPQYGIQIHNNSFWFHYGGKYDESIGQVQGNSFWAWHIPFFTWDFESHFLLSEEDTFVLVKKGEHSWKLPKKTETHDFKHTLKSGKVQERTVTLSTEKRVWHRKWLTRLKKTSISVNFEFSDELGEKAGSWKGGIMGTGCDRKEGETMVQTFERWILERKP